MNVNGMECFDSQGNLSILLKMHIARYCEESEFTIHEIITVMKESLIPISQWSFWSFSGYESFKSKIEFLSEGVLK